MTDLRPPVLSSTFTVQPAVIRAAIADVLRREHGLDVANEEIKVTIVGATDDHGGRATVPLDAFDVGFEVQYRRDPELERAERGKTIGAGMLAADEQRRERLADDDELSVERFFDGLPGLSE